MGTNVFVKGCEVQLTSRDNVKTLDPCTCTHYYELRNILDRSRLQCQPGLLWNHRANRCEAETTILQTGLCNPNAPWDRCLSNTEQKKQAVRTRCIKDGLILDENGSSGSSSGPSVQHTSLLVGQQLPYNVQLANILFVVMAMIAAAVITLVLAAIIITFRGTFKISLPTCLSLPIKSSKKPKGPGKKANKKGRTPGKPKPVKVEPSVAVVYEDIDDEASETAKNTGYKPMYKEDKFTSKDRSTVVQTFEVKTSNSPPIRPAFPRPQPGQVVVKTTPKSSPVTPLKQRPGPPTRPSPVIAVKHNPVAGNQQSPVLPLKPKSSPATPHKPGTSAPVMRAVQQDQPTGSRSPLRPLRPKTPPQRSDEHYIRPV